MKLSPTLASASEDPVTGQIKSVTFGLPGG